jgi:site-specific DNA recombinase
MNVCGYTRVSTDLQAEKGYSLEEQKERLEAFCKSKDWNLVKVYTDAGYTGSNMNRPQLQQMMAEINAYDIVLVNKLDRLSRSQKDTLYLIQDIFTPNGCSFVSLQESFDTTTPIGIAMVGILSAFAQLERSQIKERMKMGKQGRAKKGLWHGGSRPPIGYDFTNGFLIPNDDAPQVKLIYEMYSKGTSIRDIARYMSSHYTNKYSSWNSIITNRNLLQNPIYIGMIGNYEGQHEPLIDKKLFSTVQLMLDDHKLGKKVSTATHLLTGMSFCGYCGSRVTITSSKNKNTGTLYSYYRCGCTDCGKIKKIDKKCQLKRTKESVMNDIVINEILKLRMDSVEIVDKSVDIVDNSVEINKINKQINRLIDLYAICDDDSTSEIAAKIKDLKAKRTTLESEQIQPVKASKEHIMDTLSIAHETLLNGTLRDKKRIVDALIDRVIFYNDTIKIEWKFFMR